MPVATATTDLATLQGLSPAGPLWWVHYPGRALGGARATLTDVATLLTVDANSAGPPT